MDITLVTSIMNDDIHGTDNDKKTGCGINLQKGDNVNKFRRGGKVNDLKEITCERCKNAFAKKMIKADKKEMARLLKEERQREKMGLADEGIIPLGNTTAKITSAPTAPEPEPVPFERTPVSFPAPQTEETKTIPGTNVAIDSSLAAFAVTPPPAEEPVKKPESNDDFMAQFAIKKPEPEEEKPAPVKENPAPAVNNIQDDFLAQFAIPAPNQSESESVYSGTSENNIVPDENEQEESIDFTAINPPPSVYEEPIEKENETVENPVGIIDEDDIMKMFAFGNVKASSSQSPAVNASRYDYSALEEEKSSVPESEPVVNETPEENEKSSGSDWDYVANQLFGVENSEQYVNEPEQEEEMADIDLSAPESMPIPEVAEETSPALDDIALPSLDDVMPVQKETKHETPEVTAPVLDDIALPSLDDVMPVQKETKHETPEVTAPALDDIVLPSLNDVMPVHNETEQETAEVTAPVLDDISLPSLDDVMSLQNETEQETEEADAPVYDNTEDIPLQEETEVNEPVYEEEQEEYEEQSADYEYAEEYEDVQETQQEEMAVPPVQPQQYISQPQPAPVQPNNYVQQPQPVPVQPVMQQPTMQQPVMPQTMVGQIVSVPQFKGYDQNNQPIYMYVQMQMTGYNANGQPIYVPFGQPAQPMMQQPVMQQPYIPNPAPVNQPAPSPVPVSSVPKKPVVPTQPENANQPLTPGQKIAAAAAASGGMPANASNISKIAVHEHSRSTSQAFINAIAESKEYANKSLTETQGLQSRMPVLTSIEDILSEMGDNSEKEKQRKKEAMKKNVPVYQEYKTSSTPARNMNSVPKKTEEPQRPLTKAELREKKKQEKIDAKFKKDLAKKGF